MELTANEWSEFIVAAIELNTLEPFSQKTEFSTHIEAKEALNHRYFELQSLTEHLQRDLIFDDVIKKTINQQSKNIWNVEYPYAKSLDGNFVIDLNHGEIYQNESGKYVTLPPFIYQNPRFIDLFGKKELWKATEINRNFFEFSDDQENFYRVYEHDFFKNNLLFEFNFQGKWFIHNQQRNGMNEWVRSETTSTNGSEEAISISMIYTRNGIPLYLIDSLSNENYKMEELNEDGEKTGRIVANLSKKDSLRKILERFDRYENTIVLLDGISGKLSAVQFLYYELTFTAKQNPEEEWELYSDQYEGLKLSKSQYLPALSGHSNYLLLENDSSGKSEQKVLLSLTTFDPAVESTLDIKDVRKINFRNSNQVYLINVDSTTGALEPDQDLVRLHLAMRYLWKQDYAKASSYLIHFTTHDRPFSKEEIEMLESIADLKNLDNHPYALALRLRATALLLKDNHLANIERKNKERNEYIYKNKTPIGIYKNLIKTFGRYLANLKYMGEFRLNSEEEILIYKDLYHFGFEATRTQERLLKHFGKMLESQSYGLIRLRPIEKLHSTNFVVFKDPSVDQSTPSHQVIEKGSILKKSLNNYFTDVYTILKKNDLASTSDLRQIICDISGFKDELHSFKHPALLEMLDRILKLKMRSQNEQESYLAWLLISLRKDPQKFPDKPKNNLEIRNIAHSLKDSSPFSYSYVITSQEGETQPAKELPGICLTLPDVSPFGQAVIPRKEDYFEEEILYEVGLIEHSEQLRRNVLEKNIKDSFVKNKFNNLIQKLNTHANAAKKMPTVRYSIKDFRKLHSLKIRLIKDCELQRTQLAILQQQIESLLNKPFEDPSQQELREMSFSGQLDSPFSFEEALKFFLQQDSQQYQKRNPALSSFDMSNLNKLLRTFLEKATYQEQLEKVIEKIGSTVELKLKNASDDDMQKEVDDLVQLSTQKRMYSTAKHPEYLLFEYQQGILLKESQVELLDKLKIKDGKIGAPEYLGVATEAIPGMGKTFAVLPLLSLSNADGEYISINMIPESLIESMNPQIRHSLQTTSGNLLERVDIDRSTEVYSSRLDDLNARLNRIRDERRVLSLKPSSAFSLYLRFVEQFEHAWQDQQKTKKTQSLYDWLSNLFSSETQHFEDDQIDVFSHILTFFKQFGKLIIDEIDSVLDIMKSFHFTTGPKQPLEKIYQETTASTFLYLATNKTIGEKIALGFGQYQSTQGLTENFYHQEIKPLLVEALLTGHLKDKNREFQSFITELKTEGKPILENFLKGKNISEGRNFLMTNATEEIQDRFAIFFEHFNELLPLTLSKNLQEHYGKDVLHPESSIAIPYHQGNPSIDSTFGTELETAFFSVKRVLQEDVSENIVERETTRINDALKKHLETHPEKLPQEAPIYSDYLFLTGGKDIANILSLSAEDIREITRLVNQDPNVQMQLITRYVLPEISVFPSQLNAYPTVIGMLFHSIQGMSGTLWNAKTFATLIQQIYESDTSATILKLIWRDKSPISEVKLPTSTIGNKEIRNILKQIYHREGFEPGSFIDTAAIFREVADRADVAREMLLLDCWKGTPIKGVIFYDQQNKLKVMKLIGSIPTVVDLENCKLTREELVAFWDQQHTTGSDLKVAKKGKATMSVGKGTTLRDFEQSALRMRDLANEQRLSFIISDQDAQVIRANIKEWSGEQQDDLNLECLLYHGIALQGVRQGKENFSSLKQKMDAILLEKVYSILIDPNISFSEKLSLYAATRSLFADNARMRPFEQYAQPTEKKEKDIVLEQTKEKFLNSSAFQAFKEHPLLISRFKESDILQELDKLIANEKEHLTDYISVSSNPYGKEKVVQIEKLKEAEKETEKETEKEKETLKLKLNNKDFYIEATQWPRKDFFTRDYFNHIAPPVSSTLNKAGIPGADLIDKRMLGTTNLFPNTEHVELNDRFGFYQKTHNFILAAQDKNTLQWRIVLLDQNDAEQYKEFLHQDALNPNLQEKRETVSCLYHLQAKTQHSSSEIIPIKTFKNDPEMMDLIVQAKFLKGESSYTKTELPFLRSWIEKDPQQLFQLYNYVIRFKEESRNRFAGSDLEKIFSGLIV